MNTTLTKCDSEILSSFAMWSRVTSNFVSYFEDLSTQPYLGLGLVMELVTGGDLFDYILNAGYLSKHFKSNECWLMQYPAEDIAGPLTADLCDAMAVRILCQGVESCAKRFFSTFTLKASLTVTSSRR